GQIADHRFWPAGTSARNISGSPFHTHLIGLDGSGGSQDRALASSAVTFPASITINKVASPADGTAFTFTATGGLATPFTLANGGTYLVLDAAGSTQIKTFQSYSITETVPATWKTPLIACSLTGPNGGSSSVK